MSYQEQLQKEMLAFQNSLMQINNYPSSQQNPQHQQYQQQQPQYKINQGKKNDMDLEYRDTINEKVSNMKLSLPNQQRAQHMLDMNIIDNNPQFLSQIDIQKQNRESLNYTRKDNRDGMNNKMDSLMFQQFNQHQHQQQQQQQNQTANTYQYQSQSEINHTYDQTQKNRFNDRDIQNERMQNMTSLPRALYQPTQILNNPHLSTYKNSYENQYKSYDVSSTIPLTQQIFPQQQPHSISMLQQNQQQSQDFFSVMPNTNQSSRVNYKDTHNERMQGLMPLPRTCAIPNTDYTKSIQQQIIPSASSSDGLEFNKNTKTKNDRGNTINNKTNEWFMSNNLNPLGPPPKSILRDNRPVDTRQYI
jgi:hypothetical protein